MSLVRGRALRSIQTSLRHSSARVSARTVNPQRTQLVAKRFASSGGHGDHAPSSDIPWLIGGIVVTIPACYYLWPSASHADSGHHGGDHGHGAEDKHAAEEKEEPEESADAPAEEQSSEDGDDAGKESGSDGPQEAESKDEGEDASQDGGDKKASKGKVSADSEGADDTRKVESDSKGASKKRIDSGLAKNLGEGSSSQEETSSTSVKQAGMSNTDTKHSTQIDQDPEKSKKGEGAPETAKIKGAVDPSRPQK